MRLASWCEVAAIKLGRPRLHGPLRQRNREGSGSGCGTSGRTRRPPGDLWAAGFLYGVLKNKPLAEAAWYGSLISHEVVKVFGSELADNVWNEIANRMKLERKR